MSDKPGDDAGWHLGRRAGAGKSSADKDAANQREADLKAAADSVAATRAAQDEETARRRLAEDEALADERTEEDRVAASARNRLSVAAAAVNAAAGSLPDGPGAAELRAANGELQGALADYLAAAPEQPAHSDGNDQEGARR